MSDYKFHCFPESGNSRKLALMLMLCGQRFEPVRTDFGRNVTLTQTAPDPSALADKFGRFGGSSDGERFEILRWLFWDNQKLSGYMAAYRYRRAFMENSDPHVLKFMKARVDDVLKILEARLGESAFVASGQPMIADLSMTGYPDFPPNESGYGFGDSHPAIRAWLQRLAALPSWVGLYGVLPGKRLRCYV